MTEKLLAGRYQLLSEIGTGGMAIVYRALDRRTGHFVAVKVLRPDLAQNAEYVNRFQREAQAASKMTHHNIVNLLDVGMDGENRYLVMEFVQGQTLKQVIQEKGRLPARAAAEITIRILSALQHAHENGIVHRDIKPQNILVNEEGHIKVADFGIARIADTQTITRSDTVMGSVHYFSPEQARGKPSDVRSDLYSVGIVLYEMLTGRVPFDGDTQVAVAMQHLHGQPIPIAKLAPDVPPAVAHVCMVAMSKNPDNRYQSAREMAVDLRMALDGRMEVIQNHPLEPAAAAAISGRAVTPERPGGERQSGASHPVGRHARDTREETVRNLQRKVRVNKTWWIVTGATVIAVIALLAFGIRGICASGRNSHTPADFTFAGLTTAEAQAQADSVGVTLSSTYVKHPSVPAGTVISQVQQPETLRSGDTVALVISDGPEPVVATRVPDVVGLPRADAVEVLRNKGLTPTVVRVLSINPEGFVQSQDPVGLADIPEDREVTINVSGGSIPVPDVLGSTFETARTAIENAGLKVAKHVDVVSTGAQQDISSVAAQSTTANQMRGAEIGLTVYVMRTALKSCDVTLTLPESESQRALTVTLDIAGGEVIAINAGGDELTLWESVNYNAGPEQELSLRLSHWKAGECTMRVYIDGQLRDDMTRTVTLQ